MNPVQRWFFAPVPAARLAAVRWLVLGFAVVYLLLSVSLLLRPMFLPETAFRPTGVVSMLSAPLPMALVVMLYLASVGLGVLACLGWCYCVTAPLFAALLLWVTSYRNSWGMLFHTENLLVLHVIVLSLCPQAAHAWRWRGSSRTPEAGSVYGWPLRVLSLVTLGTYVIAGVSKLLHAGPAWLGGEEIRAHIAYDAVRKMELGSWYSPLGVALVHVSWVFAPLAIITLAFELGAPLALFGRRFALVWTFTCWAFHVSVLGLMMIVFPYPLLGVAFASLFPVELYLESLASRWRLRERIRRWRSVRENA